MDIIYRKEHNKALREALEFESICADIDMEALPDIPCSRTFPLVYPDEQFKFLHEAAVTVYHGTVFCAWYNCKVNELSDITPIRSCHSSDGGKIWSKAETVAADESGKLLYCPPVFGICDDKLYMLCNTMVAADHMHSMEFYCYDEAKERFEFIRSEILPFKLNTNVYQLPNGKLLLPGRMAEQDSFPSTPAVLISDSGKIDAPWRTVYVQENDLIAAGVKFVHPEQSAVVQQERITLFCRNDKSAVPLMFRSEDCGESWSKPICHDIPFSNSKIYSGTLADGRHFLIGNISVGEPEPYSPATREKLALFITEDGSLKFTKGYLLRNGYDPEWDLYPQWSYPCAYEYEGNLYIIYTMVTAAEGQRQRGAMMSVVDISSL